MNPCALYRCPTVAVYSCKKLCPSRDSISGPVRLYNTIISYLLTPCSTVLLEKLTGLQLVKKFPAFYGTRRFITAFTIVRHLSLSSARSIQSIPPHPTPWRSILILSPICACVSPVGSFPPVSPPQPCTRLSSLPHTRYMPRPSHSSRCYHPLNIGWAVQIIKFLVMYFPPLPFYLIPLRTMINKCRYIGRCFLL